MAKYIHVVSNLDKIIKVDVDDTNKALEIAKEQFSELELTDEWLNARSVDFEEDRFIMESAEAIAKLYSTQVVDKLDKKEIKDFIDIALIGDIKEYVYDETIDILENKYHKEFMDIKL